MGKAETAPSFVWRPSKMPGRPFKVGVARPTPSSLLCDVAERFCQRVNLDDAPVINIIAISRGGVAIATSIVHYLTLLGTVEEIYLTEYAPDRPNIFNNEDILTNAPAIVVDNSIHTGYTAGVVLDALVSRNVKVTSLVKLVDYQDEPEDWANFMSHYYDVQIISLYSYAEIVQQVGPPVAAHI